MISIHPQYLRPRRQATFTQSVSLTRTHIQFFSLTNIIRIVSYNSTFSTKPAKCVQYNTMDIIAPLQGRIITVIEDTGNIIQDILIEDDITTIDIQQIKPTNAIDSLLLDPSTLNITAMHCMIARERKEIEKAKANLLTKYSKRLWTNPEQMSAYFYQAHTIS